MRNLTIVSSLLLLLASGVHALNESPAAKALAAAHEAWDKGDYAAALTEYIRLIESPDGAALHEAIALKTGELYVSRELTSDGRAARFSHDGRFVAYETGLEVSRRTKVLRNDGTLTEVADLPGISATFSPIAASIAYLKIADTPDLQAAAQALTQASLTAPNRNALVQALTWQVLRNSSVVIRDLTTNQDREILTGGPLKTGLTFAANGRELYFLGGEETDESRNDIYKVSAALEGSGLGSDKALVRLTDAAGFKGTPVVSADGAALLYVPANQNPFRKPQPPAAAGGGRGDAAAPAAGTGGGGLPAGAPGGAGGAAAGRGGAAAGGGRGGAGQGAGPSFAIVNLTTGKTASIQGSAPSFSADGKTLVYVARIGEDSQVLLGPPVELPQKAAVVKKSASRLDAPSLTADGRRVAFQEMARDDWEVVVANADGTAEERLTRDVQHDLLPRFLGPDRLLTVVGEARHRRSFVHDLKTRSIARLFHNNTVRTIAPEYQWVTSNDGNQLLIAAERDGDTVSPARGVYLMDLRQKVSKAHLLARLRENLAGETRLRAGAVSAFAPIAADVKRVVDRVSVPRIYNYEKALFEFDSKHITRPGNRLASEYLFNAYASFGYQPEYQWFEPRNALDGKTANVIATLKGTTNPELVYVVSSHYDSVAGGPGADDDTSGTAALLEAARVLADTPMPATIIFASFTGEEAGLLGSREFVRRAVESKMQLVGALNNDMIGWTNDFRLDNTIRYSNPGIRDIQHGAAMLFTRLITYDALYFKSTDAAAYYDAYGDIVGGIGSYPVLSNPHYHQSHDLLEFENHELIAETSKTTVGTLMMLASSPSRIKNLTVEGFTGGAATVAWTPSPESGVTTYVVASGPASAPMTDRMTVKTPRARVTGLKPGDVISVKAVNARGLEGWDWARTTVR
jgi:hypothetical protein